jgi:hypothetical protein
MKRTATKLMLLAGLSGGGCATSDQRTTQAPPQPQAQQQQAGGGFGTVTRGKQITNLQGPMGEPIVVTRGAAPTGMRTAGGSNTLVGAGGVIRPVGAPGVVTADVGGAVVPGVGGSVISQANYIANAKEALGQLGQGNAVGPNGPKLPNYGIVPVPTTGAPGAVAAVGAYTGGAVRGPAFSGRSSINFTGPAGMKVTWQLPDGSFNDEANALTAPKEYNFLQGQVYRLRLSSILPDFPGRSFYPTLEVAPANPKSLTFLSHSSVPITFAADDFAQARAGNLVVKVIYLPDPINQDFSTIVGAEEVVSTRLEPGADPVAEAQRRGTILAVIRMGNIDLENRVSPSMVAPPPGGFGPPPGAFPAPGAVPPGFVPGPGAGGPPLMTPPAGVMPAPVPPGTDTLPPKAGDAPPKLGAGALPLTPPAPSAPGTASVSTRAPAALPLPPSAPTDLPPAPLAPLAPPAPKTK